MVLEAARAANSGASADEVVALVENLRSRTRVYGAIDTLENLKKGGRIGNAQALLGSVLSIKPLIDISSGVVEEAGRQRTRRKSLGWLRDKVAEHGDAISNLSVMHAQADDIDVLLEMLAALVDPADMRVGVIGPVVASHGGPGVVGMAGTRSEPWSPGPQAPRSGADTTRSSTERSPSRWFVTATHPPEQDGWRSPVRLLSMTSSSTRISPWLSPSGSTHGRSTGSSNRR